MRSYLIDKKCQAQVKLNFSTFPNINTFLRKIDQIKRLKILASIYITLSVFLSIKSKLEENEIDKVVGVIPHDVCNTTSLK